MDLEKLYAESRAQVVATVNGRQVTRGELSAAFDLVADKDHWKNPVNAIVTASADDLNMIREAVIFFTGSVPHFDALPASQQPASGPGRYRVRAAGYFATIGA